MERRAQREGFTLIEMSIVLVIIGLIVGGILVGRDLVAAAGVRAQISQIEKYQIAVNTFRGKYGYLPGDINATAAVQFGFATRGPYAGEGDGNGVIEDNRYNNSTGNSGYFQGGGEITLFWRDLSTAGLIDGGFSTGAYPCCTPVNPVTASTSPNLNSYFPSAKLGDGNYVFVWSGGAAAGGVGSAGNGINYFGVEQISQNSSASGFASTGGIRVIDAASIDQKIDDGLPLSGNVTSIFLTNTMRLNSWGYAAGAAVTSTSARCYDNAGSASNPTVYSITQSGGANPNCALSFRFQ